MPLFTKASKLCQCGFGHMCTSCQSPLWFEHPTTSVYLYKVGCWDYNTQPPFTTDMSSVTSAHVPPFTLDSVLDSLGASTKNKEDLIEQEARRRDLRTRCEIFAATRPGELPPITPGMQAAWNSVQNVEFNASCVIVGPRS